MRSRNIKPGFFKNEFLAECEPLSRILFAGLWCMADREGRMEYRPKRIKAELLPYDDCMIDQLIDQLLKRKFVIIYKIDESIYLSIPSFNLHQNPNIKENESTIPEPNEHCISTVQELLIPDSPFPHTDSPIPITRPAPFELFWKAYPKKKSKGQAEKVWKRLRPNEQLLATMIATIEIAKTSDDWLKEGGKYIPYPATWLNAKGWEDEGVEQHPMAGNVSEATMKSIRVMEDWRPPGEK